MVAMASVSGSMSTAKRRLYQLEMASRSLVIPREAEYRWLAGLPAASMSFATMWGGVARSGLPIPKSMMSSPRRRASIFRALTVENTYGGRRFMRGNSSMAFMQVSFRLNGRDFQKIIIANGRDLSNSDLQGIPGFT